MSTPLQSRACDPATLHAKRNARARRRRGLTLIEIMVVMTIVAVAVGGLSVGIRALTRTRLRSACTTLAAAARYAYQRALTHGTTVRLTLDFGANTFSLDESLDPITLVRSDSAIREEAARDSDEGDPGAALNPWELAAKRLENPDKLEFAKPPFSPITTASGKAIARYTNHPLGQGVSFRKLVVAHEEEERTEGKVDLFFFPNGTTQHSVIQLADASDTVYSVEIHPLTGRAHLYDIPYEPELLFDDPKGDADRNSELEDSR